LTAQPPANHVDLYGDPLPEGAVMRLGTVGFRVANLAGVGFRKAGELVAITSDPAIHVWPADGKGGATVTKLADKRHFVALSPDARFAAGVADSVLRVWDLTGAKPVEYLTRDIGWAQIMVFDPTGTWLAACNQTTKKLRIGNLTAKSWVEVDLSDQLAESLAFSPNGKWLAVTALHLVQVFDVAQGKEVARIAPSKTVIRWATPSADGSTLAVLPVTFLNAPPPKLKLLAIPTGEEQGELAVPGGFGRCVTFSPDGKTVWSGGEFGVREWEPVARQFRRDVAGPAATPIIFSPDGTRIASYSDSAVMFCHLNGGKPVRPDLAEAGHTAQVRGIVPSPDGQLIATNDLKGEVRVWDAVTGRLVSAIRGYSWLNGSVVFLPDSNAIITVGEDRVTPTVWDARSGKELRRFVPAEDRGRTETTREVKVSPDGKTLVTTTEPNSIPGNPPYTVRWDVGTGREIDRVERPRKRDMFPPKEAPNGEWVVEMGKATRTGTMESVVIVQRAEALIGAASVCFTPDSRVVAVPRLSPRSLPNGDRPPGQTVVFDLTVRAKITELPTGEVHGACFTANGRHLIIASDRGVALWEIATASLVRSYPIAGSGTVFIRDGRSFITGQTDGTALVWDFTGTNRPPGTATPVASEKDLAAWWTAFAGADAAAAYTAGWELTDRPGQTIPFLRDRLQPAKVADEAVVKKLVDALDAPVFADREKADSDLRALGDLAVATLRKLQDAGLSAEQGARVKRILAAALDPVLSAGETLRQVRAVAVLERIGSADAKKLLEEIAGGAPDARVTKEAKVALERLTTMKR
jgi:WD40 repeat protein